MGLIATPPYLRSLKQLRATPAEIKAVEDTILGFPEAGVIVPGLHGVRKLRFAMGGRGKSGGGRVLYYVHDGSDIYLLVAYSKADQPDLTGEQRKRLMRIVADIKE